MVCLLCSSGPRGRWCCDLGCDHRRAVVGGTVTIWVYSMVSHPKRAGGIHHYETMVSRTHPLLVLKEWREDEEIQDQPTILWYKRLDEHDWYTPEDPLAVQKYVDQALENYGEFG